MSEILKKIITVKQSEVADAQSRVTLSELKKQVADLPRFRNFYRAITKENPRGINVIAEIKRASPSAGLIREDFDPVRLADLYQRCGADAISVLTDKSFFQGSLDYIGQVKTASDLPVLRKDFIIDPYQVYEARAAGADAILLIAEALNVGRLSDLMILAHSLTLSVLLEVHEIDSLLRIRSMIGFPQEHYTLLGINNRNLKTMQVDPGNSLRLRELVDREKGLVSESGINRRDQVEALIRAGFDGILMGETLMRSHDIAKTFVELFDPRE